MRGFPHGDNQASGSALEEPLFDDGEFSLWLEHVLEEETNKDFLWLMWYRNGRPTIPLSGVFKDNELARIARKLSSYLPFSK